MDNTYQNEVEAPQADALQPEKKKHSQFLRVLVGVVAVSLIGAGSLFGKSLLGCSSATGMPHPLDNKDIQYLPFQAEEGGGWGLISPDGEVLFADEFKEQPTIATNDRFFVKNSDGLWEMYTATEKPQKVGDEYVSICTFARGCDVTPAVRKDKGVEFIDKDGNVKFKFDKVNGKPVEKCTAFDAEGHAVFSIDSGEFEGVVDTNGNIVLQPNYGAINSYGGYFYGVEQPRTDIDWNSTSKLLDKNGKEIFSSSPSKCTITEVSDPNTYGRTYMADGKIAVQTPRGRSIIDKDGNVVLEPFRIINFVFFDGKKLICEYVDLWGAQTLDGKSIVQAKYHNLYPMKGFSGFFAQNEDGYWVVLNENGERIGSEEYENMVATPWEKIYVKKSKSGWILLDTKGHEIKLKQKIANFGDLYNADSEVYADNGPWPYEAYITLFERYTTRLNKLTEEVVTAKDADVIENILYSKYLFGLNQFDMRSAALQKLISKKLDGLTEEEINEQYGEGEDLVAASQKLQTAIEKFSEACNAKPH